MKVAIILCMVGVALASPKPGGYIAKGGVYKPEKTPDYMGAASQAGKFAWNKRFEAELDVGGDIERGERDAAYVPTFFTSEVNHAQLTNSRDNVRPQREIAKEPLYYETYHNRR